MVLFSAVAVSAAGGRTHRVFSAHLDFSKAEILEVETAENPSPEESAAAEMLAAELAKIAGMRRSGLVLERAGTRRANPRKKAAAGRVRIVLQNTAAADKAATLTEFADASEYGVEVGARSVRLTYSAPKNAFWAVGNFLRRYCGVEYFSPAEWGAEYSEARVRFGRSRRFFKPDFFCASVYDYPQSLRWRRLNGLDTDPRYMRFYHNLDNIFPRRTITETPQYFGFARDGRGRLFRSVSPQRDLPNYRTRDRAAAAAIDALGRSQMFPLGISDTSVFDARESYLRYKRGYFRGYPDWSNAVFAFTNAVAEKVSAAFPSGERKYVGALAYLICENPPDFKLAQNVIPFFTTDRANYFDPTYRSGDFETLEKWGRSGAETFGVYGYLYGNPYLFPREIMRFEAEAMRRARACGARLYVAETFAQWGFDAKKMWILARLAENCSADYDLLSDEFFEKYYADAAFFMRRFFDLAELVWTRRTAPAMWLAFYKAENALGLWDADLLGQMDAALKNARLAAQNSANPNVAARVAETTALFEITKAAFAFHSFKREMFQIAPDVSEREVLDALKRYRRLEADFKAAVASASRLGKNGFDFYFADKYAPTDALVMRLAMAAVRGGREDFLRRQMRELGFDEEFGAACRLARGVGFSFSQGVWRGALGEWNVVKFDFDGVKIHAEGDGKNGTLRFENSLLSGISRNFYADDGAAVSFSGKVRNSASAGTLCYAGLVFLDAYNKPVGRKTLILPDGGRSWRIVAVAPKGTVGAAVSVFATRQKKGDALVLESVKFERAAK